MASEKPISNVVISRALAKVQVAVHLIDGELVSWYTDTDYESDAVCHPVERVCNISGDGGLTWQRQETVPERIKRRYFEESCSVVMPDGSVQEVAGLAWRAAACPIPVEKLDQSLTRRGLQRRGRVGEAPSTLVKALDLWEVRRAHLRNACPTCPIKPG